MVHEKLGTEAFHVNFQELYLPSKFLLSKHISSYHWNSIPSSGTQGAFGFHNASILHICMGKSHKMS